MILGTLHLAGRKKSMAVVPEKLNVTLLQLSGVSVASLLLLKIFIMMQHYYYYLFIHYIILSAILFISCSSSSFSSSLLPVSGGVCLLMQLLPARACILLCPHPFRLPLLHNLFLSSSVMERVYRNYRSVRSIKDETKSFHP